MPRHPPDGKAAALEAAPTAADARKPRPPGQRTLLIVDDEVDILESLDAYFRRTLPNVKVLLARSAAEGVKVLRRDAVDLVIADFRMAGMDGLEFLRVAQELAPQAPRIMITAYPDAHLAVQARVATDVSLLVTKPFDVATFGRSIAAIMGITDGDF
ncbi:MAG TPA: response regulator [Candidatus Thermoplasmatota archaeon]|nr:response regulator [Candidatus Thermoplasmatota archaeon]